MNQICASNIDDRPATQAKASLIIIDALRKNSQINQVSTNSEAVELMMKYCDQSVTISEQSRQSQRSAMDLLDISPMMSLAHRTPKLSTLQPGKGQLHRKIRKRVVIRQVSVCGTTPQNEESEQIAPVYKSFSLVSESAPMPEAEPTPKRKTSPRSKARPWSHAESGPLRLAVTQIKPLQWNRVARYMNSRNEGCSPRTAPQCRQRWTRVEAPSMKKGNWSSEEDLQLIDAVLKCPPKNWAMISAFMPGRADIQIRKRLQTIGKYLVEMGLLSEEYLPSGSKDLRKQ